MSYELGVQEFGGQRDVGATLCGRPLERLGAEGPYPIRPSYGLRVRSSSFIGYRSLCIVNRGERWILS